MDRKTDVGWTETQALENALQENPLTVFMYCLHAQRVNVRVVFPPTALATIIDTAGEGGEVHAEYGRVEPKEAEEEEEDEEEEKEEEEDAADNAVTINQISRWLKVNFHTLHYLW